MSRAEVLFAHELAVVGRAVKSVLECHGFGVRWVQRASEVREALQSEDFQALVLDVALPDELGYALIEVAREAGVECVILVAAVHRKTSYKRRPTRLYGADDYVEIHHLGDHLPLRLKQRLGLLGEGEGEGTDPGAEDDGDAEGPGIPVRVAELGDERLGQVSESRLAELLVADLLLYNGDAFGLHDEEGVRRRLDAQISELESLFDQLRPGGSGPELIAAALHQLMARPALGTSAN